MNSEQWISLIKNKKMNSNEDNNFQISSSEFFSSVRAGILCVCTVWVQKICTVCMYSRYVCMYSQ